MKEELISFETAKLAKEKGFWIPKSTQFIINDHEGISSFGVLPNQSYDDIKIIYFQSSSRYLFPTQTLLQKWLREKHNIQMFIAPAGAEPVHYLVIIPKCYIGVGEPKPYMSYSTYEEALEDGLKHALNLIK